MIEHSVGEGVSCRSVNYMYELYVSVSVLLHEYIIYIIDKKEAIDR